MWTRFYEERKREQEYKEGVGGAKDAKGNAPTKCLEEARNKQSEEQRRRTPGASHGRL